MKRSTLIKYSIFLALTVTVVFSIMFLDRFHQSHTPQETITNYPPVVLPDADAIIRTKIPDKDPNTVWDVLLSRDGFNVCDKNTILINRTYDGEASGGFQYNLIQGKSGAFAFFFVESCSDQEAETLCRSVLIYRKYFPIIIAGNISEKASVQLVHSASMELIDHNGDNFLASDVEATLMPEQNLICLRFLPCQKKLDLDKKMISLTFDDGPHPVNTPFILSELKRYNASATFFVTGSNAEQHPEIIYQIFKDGNELGNHTNLHESFSENTPSIIHKTVKETNDKIKRITGLPTFLLRPPGGSCYDRNGNLVSPGFPLVLWKIDTLDYVDGRTAEEICNSILSAESGDIILMHDVHKVTADSIGAILKQLTDNGFQLVTVSEMFEFSGAKLENNIIYRETA